MSRKHISASDDSGAVLVPPEVLNEMGLNEGDEVDLSVVNRTLIVRSLDDAERARKLEETTAEVLERRGSSYRELAKGIE
jgi:antitoxin component of MazEF toxin-antitoxin module